MGHRVTLGENDEELTEEGVHAMTHDDDARVADLLARLGEGDSRELFRRLLQHGMQELIDAELTAAIGAAPHERTECPVEPAQRVTVPVVVDPGW